jgi:hypothetical protein
VEPASDTQPWMAMMRTPARVRPAATLKVARALAVEAPMASGTPRREAEILPWPAESEQRLRLQRSRR